MPPSALIDEVPTPPEDANRTRSRCSLDANGCQRQSALESCDPAGLHDLICVGFGPASLAIAIAIHDALVASNPSPKLSHLRNERPRVAFLERQSQFAWHDGMLLPDARMQINFIKDLATLRDPRSEFTFLNYLHHQERLVHFTNLGTFFPLRVEYEDYMRWCADRFQDVVHYGQEVLDVKPETPQHPYQKTQAFIVRSTDTKTGQVREWKARHVVVAIGGKPRVPWPLPSAHPHVVHSSRYLKTVPRLLKEKRTPFRIAVIGSGQSAAEIFSNLYSNYPESKVTLVTSNAALKPSDDSPL